MYLIESNLTFILKAFLRDLDNFKVLNYSIKEYQINRLLENPDFTKIRTICSQTLWRFKPFTPSNWSRS